MAVNLPIQNFYQPTIGPDGWVRPSDWITITDTPDEVQFLVGDMFDAAFTLRTQFTRTSGSQDITIDWGDGTTDVVSTTGSTTTNHQYTAGTGTPCSLGYTTFKIRVYFTGSGVSVMTNCIVYNVLLPGDTVGGYRPCALLEAYYGDNTQNSTLPQYASNSNSTLSYFTLLQYIKLPATVTWTSCSNLFNGCTSLTKVIMPTSGANMTSFISAFSACYNLLEITFPSNATAITTLATAFSTCYNLKKVIFPTSLDNCTSLSSTFSNCYNLKNITFPSINKCTNFASTFTTCYQLEWVKFSSLPTFATAITFTSTFNACSNLQNVYFPATCNSGSTYDVNTAFSGCFQLKSIVFPSNMNVSSFASTFTNCNTINSCILPTSTPACTTFANAFNNCYTLTNIQLPTTVAATINMTGAFVNCYKLQSITIDSSYVFTTLLNTFNGCVSLKEINWNPGAQNSLTSLASTFSNCRLLTSVTMPTSMTSLNTLSNTFATCTSLISITFPASLNAVTTMSSTFTTCSKLSSVTLPTSMSSCTDFNSVFTQCSVIRSVTFPNTVSASTISFNSAFANCGALETVVFPGSQQLSLVNNISSIFNYCTNLKTITNFDKIGSLTATPLVNAGTMTNPQLLSISFSCPLSVLTIPGTAARPLGNVQSVRLLNTSAGQWTGASPQINVSYTTMSTAQLVQLFTDMAAQGVVVSKTINITSCTGAAGLTAADRLIITSKGWTITG